MDVLMLKCRGQAIGVCILRKPSDTLCSFEPDDLINDVLDRQVCNYLQVLKTYHGVAQPIGIVPTYNQWKVCWLRGAQAMVDATNMDEISRAVAPTHTAAALDDGEESFEPLFCSEVYRRNDPQVVQMLAWAIYKMYHAKRESVAELNSSFSCESRTFAEMPINESEASVIRWRTLPQDTVNNLHLSLIGRSTQHVFLFQDYRGGAEGRVWLVCSHTGQMCVMKLSPEQSFQEESDRWHEIWKCHTFVGRINFSSGVHALFMPFAFQGQCTDGIISFRGINHWTSAHGDVADITHAQVTKDRIDPSQIAELLEDPLLHVAAVAIRSMAEAGWKHLDLCWHHVALLPIETKDGKTLELKPILIDLGQCERINNNNEIGAIVEEGLNDLKRELERSVKK